MLRRVFFLTFLILFGGGALYYFLSNALHIDQNAIKTYVQPPSQDVVELFNENPTKTGPFTVFGDYQINIFADLGKETPRVLNFDDNGVLYTSLPAQGKIVALLDSDDDGVSDDVKVILSGLNRPHGFAFYNNALYVAETDRVVKYSYIENEFRATSPEQLFLLPAGGRHWSRTIKIYDDKLYTSVGSSCDVCIENVDERSSVLISNLDGSDLRVFASGLRNTVFFDFDDRGRIWGSDMGRDFLGDNLPPDELNIIEDGKDYGWPWCYGKGIRDQKFEGNKSFDCTNTQNTEIDYPAHIAPLGTTFIKTGILPEEYNGDLLVSFHGSWNSSEKVGYKIVRVDIENGHAGQIKDFISGFLDDDGGVIGRPVDLVFNKHGVLFISDDKANVIYRLYNK